MSGFKTSETSGLQNVRFTKRQVYKTSGLQNVRFTKRQVFKTSGCKKTAIYILYLLLVEIRRFCCSHVYRQSYGCVLFFILGTQTWQFLYFLFNKYIKLKNPDVFKLLSQWTFWNRTLWNQTFWNLTFYGCTCLSARCHFTGPKKLSISRAQPSPTCPRNVSARIKNITHGAI